MKYIRKNQISLIYKIRNKRASYCKIRQKRIKKISFGSSNAHLFNYRSEGKIRIVAPAVFCLSKEKHRAALLAFISLLWRHHHSKKTLYLDLSKVRALLPSGTIKFLSVLDELLQNDASITCNFPRNRTVRELFQHAKVFSKLGRHNNININNNRMVKSWVFFSGNNLDDFKQQQIRGKLKGKLSATELSSLIKGIKDAIINVVDHAYDIAYNEEYGEYIKSKVRPDVRWSLCLQCDKEMIAIVLCDNGIGIKKSLCTKKKSFLENFFQMVLPWSSIDEDYLYINAAFEVGNSRFKEESDDTNRGQGLPAMLRVVKNSNDRRSFLSIFSNKGSYTYDKQTDGVDQFDYKNSIDGTVVQWTFDRQAA